MYGQKIIGLTSESVICVSQKYVSENVSKLPQDITKNCDMRNMVYQN
jgi:hypothetical protein